MSKQDQINGKDVKSNKPTGVSVNSAEELEAWLHKYEEYAEMEDKTLATREEVKSNQRDPEDNDGVNVIDKDSEEFNTLKFVFQGKDNVTLPVTDMVIVDEEIVTAFNNNDESKIPPMFDDYMRAGDERLTGFLTELATEQLLHSKQDELDVKILPDDGHHHAGDVLINNHIVEVKGVKMSSAAYNLTARHHGQAYSPMMEIKTGIMADAYLHCYIMDLGDNGFVVGFVGLAQTNPETNGTLANSPRIYTKKGTNFAIISQLDTEFEPVNETGLNLLEDKIHHYPSVVTLNEEE